MPYSWNGMEIVEFAKSLSPGDTCLGAVTVQNAFKGAGLYPEIVTRGIREIHVIARRMPNDASEGSVCAQFCYTRADEPTVCRLGFSPHVAQEKRGIIRYTLEKML